jgi:hypothetical protein
MAYTFSRDRHERTECPFCKEGEIKIQYTLPIKKENISTTVGVEGLGQGRRHQRRKKVQNDCPKCGAKRKDVQKRLKKGVTRPPSNREILKWLKEAGLPRRSGGRGNRTQAEGLSEMTLLRAGSASPGFHRRLGSDTNAVAIC